MRLALNGFLVFGLQLVAEPAAAQGGVQVVLRAGAVAPWNTGVTHDGYTASGSLGFEIGSLVAWKATEGLHLRAGLIVGSSDITTRDERSDCADRALAYPNCELTEDVEYGRVFAGPAFRRGRFGAGIDLGWRAFLWGGDCVLLNRHCLAHLDFQRESILVHPHIEYDAPIGGRAFRVEAGSFLGDENWRDVTVSIGLMF